ncbi:MAG: Rpn family recombination-promoting nuclease/putative transposase [Bacteroidales bacterium]|nr:Rpn family recombination-promoting nuclease/putative transposase [Bacteroidales bacterium]
MAKIQSEFLNMQADFTFKRVFGSEMNKHILIRFLNALFDGKLFIKDVTFHDKEKLPSSPKGKRIVYDVYCTAPSSKMDSAFFPAIQKKGDNKNDSRDHHFILEMQNIYTPPFEERIVFYACKMISEQGKSGWDYELDPVFAIAITDFNFSHLSPKLIRDVMLIDRETKEPLTDKVHILLCSLKELPEKWEDCKTELEEMLFLIKNMDKMDTMSLAYIEGKYAEVFEAARSTNLKDTETIAYSQSLDKLNETIAGFRYAKEEGIKLGKAEGRAEGKAEGRAETLQEKAQQAKEMGLSDDIIKRLFGM